MSQYSVYCAICPVEAIFREDSGSIDSKDTPTMLDIVKLSEELRAKLQHETDVLMSDRLMTKEVLEARAKELAHKRDDELRRVDQWASQQKALISEIFTALLAEIEADRLRNETNLARMKGEVPAPAKVRTERHLKAAE